MNTPGKQHCRSLACLLTILLVAFLLNACAPLNKNKISQVQLEGRGLKSEHADTRASIVAVGDIMLGGKGAPYFEKQGYDYPFTATKHFLQAADLVIGNLETALTHSSDPFVEKKYRFKNPPDKVAAALRAAGFDIVSLANNHSMDYGEVGLTDTITALHEHGIRYHGAGLNLQQARQAVVMDLSQRGQVGFIAYSNTFPEEFWASETRAGTAFGHERYVREDVNALVEQGVEIIVVSFHWGRERTTELRDYQTLLAHAAIDSGADLVIGHHPHIVQAIERYKHGLVLYSLGNYTFSTFSNNVQYSAMARVQFRDGVVDRLELLPIDVNNFRVQLQPQPLTVEANKKVLDEILQLSESHTRGFQLDRSGLIVLDLSQ